MRHIKLYEAIMKLESLEDCEDFLKDLATEKELQDFSDRLEVATLLLEGHTYEQISLATKMSSATIARVNRAILYGNGGYKKVIKGIEK